MAIQVSQTPEQDEQDRPIGLPMANLGPQEGPFNTASPILRAAAMNAPTAPQSPAFAIPSPGPAMSMPSQAEPPPPKLQSAGSELWQRAGQVQNPFARILARIGAGVARGADIGAEALAPRLAMVVPGSEINTGLKNRANEQTFEKQQAADIAGQRAGAAETEAQAAKERADTEANKQPTQAQEKSDWRPVAGTNWEINSGTGETRQMQGVPAPPQKPEKQPTDPFHEWVQDPKNYEAFQKAMESIKKPEGGMFGSPYASVRALDMAALYFPEAFGPILAQTNKTMGWNMTPDQIHRATENFQANLARYNGEMLGERSKLNPTSGTEGQAQMADKVLNELPRVNQEIKTLAPNLGPVKGRAMVGFLLGTVGSTGNPQLDGALTTLKTDMALLDSAGGKFHTGLMESINDLKNSADVGKNPAAALLGFTASIEKWAKQAQGEGKNVGGGAAPPSGVTIPKGWKWTTYKGQQGIRKGNQFRPYTGGR